MDGSKSESPEGSSEIYKIIKFSDDDPENTVFTLRGECPKCRKGMHNLVVFKARKINANTIKMHMRCIVCLSDITLNRKA